MYSTEILGDDGKKCIYLPFGTVNNVPPYTCNYWEIIGKN